jgi:hypothetical protein
MVTGVFQRFYRDLCEEECVCGPKRTCEGLECLCRPRFFAGQLLTDEDLRRLDHYIVAKGRLHNKYLHGTGVVCGLEVVCNACDDTVTVRTGYAIGPCGEDIVVCADTRVDIGELIRAHRHQKAQADPCRPYGENPNTDCEAAEQDWILAICYDEKPSRGVTSLRQPEKQSCGCGCGCGGGSKNGHSHSNGQSSNGSCGCTTKTRRPTQCEPTLTCEGYKFKLIKPKSKTSVDNDRTSALSDLTSRSELVRRVFCCLSGVLARVQKFPTNASPQQLADFCCDFKADLRVIIETGNVHDCMLGARLSEIVCPAPNDPDFTQKLTQAMTLTLQVAVDLYKACICSAMLPPCSTGSPDDCVPLATITVRTADLKVLYICNWSERKFVVTFPTLGYWLGWLPLFDTLRNAMVNLCCTRRRQPSFAVNSDFRIRENVAAQPAGDAPRVTDRPPTVASAAFAATAAERSTEQPMEPLKGNAFTNLTSDYARRTTSLSGLEATVLAGLGLKGEGDVDLASDLEILNPMAALGLTRLASPAGESLVPEELTAVLGQIFARDRIAGEAPSTRTSGAEVRESTGRAATTKAAASPETARIAKLEASLEKLAKTVETQRKTIDKLQKGQNQKGRSNA